MIVCLLLNHEMFLVVAFLSSFNYLFVGSGDLELISHFYCKLFTLFPVSIIFLKIFIYRQTPSKFIVVLSSFVNNL
jgi:hypothetical protein